MLVVAVNEIEPWFKYILEQFIKINSLNEDYIITTYSDHGIEKQANDGQLMLEYSDNQRYANSLFIPMKKEFKTDDYIWIRKNLPIYKDTILKTSDDLQYDIFYNAFVHLSRLEEWEAEKNSKYIQSYSFKHPRKDKRIWKIPIVNYLFNELEAKIKKKYPTAQFGGKEKPVVEFSHDVDYIYKTVQLRFKQSAFHLFNSGKFLLLGKFKKGLSKLGSAFSFAFQNSNYWQFGYWEDLELRLNIKSTYYFFVKRNGKNRFNMKSLLIDPSYDVSKNKRLQDKFKELISNGNRLGIHGSYLSSEDVTLFRKEKEVLENIIGFKIIKSRQHWLNYYESKTPYILDKSGIEEDSTLGFNDISGFRSGVASVYNPYDHMNNKQFLHKEIPMVVIDSHIYDYGDNGGIEWLFNAFEQVKNAAFSVNWHQRVASPDYGWHTEYERLVSSIAGLRT